MLDWGKEQHQRQIDDALWEIDMFFLPPERRGSKDGRMQLSDRAAIEGIVYMLRSGIGGEHLPRN